VEVQWAQHKSWAPPYLKRPSYHLTNSRLCSLCLYAQLAEVSTPNFYTSIFEALRNSRLENISCAGITLSNLRHSAPPIFFLYTNIRPFSSSLFFRMLVQLTAPTSKHHLVRIYVHFVLRNELNWTRNEVQLKEKHWYQFWRQWLLSSEEFLRVAPWAEVNHSSSLCIWDSKPE